MHIGSMQLCIYMMTSIHVSMVSCTHTCVMVVWGLHGGVHDIYVCIHDGSMHVVGIHDSQLCIMQ